MPKRPPSWPQIDLADTNTPQPLSQPLRPLNLSCHKAQEHILSFILNLGVGQYFLHLKCCKEMYIIYFADVSN